MTTIEIRQAQPRDYLQIGQVDALAFASHIRKTMGVTTFPERTSKGIEAYLQRTGGGGLVGEIDGQIVGYIFYHRWGSLGWIGPLGVDPRYQVRGFGKELVAKVLAIFEEMDVREIGLETMPDSAKNIGLYMSLGFQPINLTFDLVRTVKHGKAGQTSALRPQVSFLCCADLDFDQFCAISRELTEQVIPGLDYLPELELLLKYDFGEVLVMEEDGQPVGIALLMTKGLRGEEDLTVAIRGMVIKAGSTELEYVRLSELLAQVYKVSRDLGGSKVTLSIYSAYDSVIRYLINQENFTIKYPYLRMVVNDALYPVPPKGGIEISKWRG